VGLAPSPGALAAAGSASAAGGALASLGALGLPRGLPRGLALCALAAAYSSLVSSAAPPFLHFQWDILLTEAGYALGLACAVPPVGGPLSRFLLVKLMLPATSLTRGVARVVAHRAIKVAAFAGLHPRGEEVSNFQNQIAVRGRFL
jgi:hypothetical protein